MYKPNAATQFYLRLFGKRDYELDPSLSLWQNIYIWKHEKGIA